MLRTVNDQAIALIKRFEDCRLTAYPDVGGVPTIGWGHTRGVRLGMTCGQDHADTLLLVDLAATEAAVEYCLGAVKATDNQFGAMVSLAFNIGAAAFATSSVLIHHRRHETQAAAASFLLWNMATIDGELVEVAGLTNRRAAERVLYLTA